VGTRRTIRLGLKFDSHYIQLSNIVYFSMPKTTVQQKLICNFTLEKVYFMFGLIYLPFTDISDVFYKLKSKNINVF